MPFPNLLALLFFLCFSSFSNAEPPGDKNDEMSVLVSADWLNRHLDDPDLVVLDCSIIVTQEEDGTMQNLTGRSSYDSGHIPSAGFADLLEDLSDTDSPYLFKPPTPEQFAAAMSALGVGDETRVVLYDNSNSAWAARVWWMLRAIGFDNAAVLDGGWSTWIAEGRPISTEGCAYGPETLNVKPRPALFVGPDAVQAAINDTAVCTINALTPDIHSGENLRYGRAGRIPGSVNISAAEMQDPETLKIPTAEDSAGRFIAVGADSAARIIVYCGGGIAASLDAFLLHQLGHEDIAIYDNSMTEWANDPARPMETD